MNVLTVNVGSSSVKLSLVSKGDAVLMRRDLCVGGDSVDMAELEEVLRRPLPQVDAVAHRIVHGGPDLVEPLALDEPGIDRLALLSDLAPLHQAGALAAIEVTAETLPDVPAFACFDTAFHATLPFAARTYALPRAWREELGLRRYGFHGLSHAHAVRRSSELLGVMPRRLISCHLGSGASLCAVREGKSIDTTMGFTPLEGLVMATRSGSVDPGLVLWLLDHTELSPWAIRRALERESGLSGLAGTSDMRRVLAGARAGEVRCGQALDVYLHRLRGGIGSMAAALGGLDALVFTGGVGEHAWQVRAEAVEGLEFLGVELDSRRNRTADGDCDLTPDGAPVRTLVVRAREDLEMARQVRARLLAPAADAVPSHEHQATLQ